MVKQIRCCIQLGLIVIFLTQAMIAQQNLNAGGARATADEAAIRLVIERYFDLYQKKDLDGLAALFSPNSPILSSRRELWERLFPVENYKFSELQISRIRVNGDRASTRISTARTSTLIQEQSSRVIDLRAEYGFIRENGAWKLLNETPAAYGLTGDLIDAKSDAEREALLKEEPAQLNRDLLQHLIRNSDASYVSGNYARAMNLLLSAKIVAQMLGEKPELGNIWTNLGIIHLLQGRTDQALEAYTRSLALSQELGRRSEVGRITANIGMVYSAMGRRKEALEHLDRGLKIAEELGEKPQVAQVYENIGSLYYDQNQYGLASEYYQKSASMFEMAEMKSAAAQRLLKVAKTEYEQGNNGGAIDFYNRALGKYEEAGERRSRGYVFHSIANVYYLQGDYAQALAFYTKCIAAEEEVGNIQAKAGALQGIGLVQTINGSHQLSLEAFEKNLSIIQSLNDKAETAAAFSKVGNAYYNLGRLDKALEAFLSALDLRKQGNESEDIAAALLDVGILYAAQNDYEKALAHYEESRALFEKSGNFSGVGSALLNTSSVYFAQQKYEKTIKIAEMAAAAGKRGEDSDVYWQARHRAGRAHYRLKEYPAARKALSEAIATIETVRPQRGKGTQPRYYEDRIAPYRAMVDVTIAEGDGNEAFNYAERAKARTLLGILRSGRIWITKTMSAPEREREQSFQRQLSVLPTQIARELEKSKANQARVEDLQRVLAKTQSEYDAFLAQLYKRHPHLKELRGEAKPLTITEAVKIAPDTRTAVLDFIETEEQYYLFVFTRPDRGAAAGAARKPVYPLRVFVLGVTRSNILTRGAALSAAIEARADASPILRDLYELLIGTAAPALADKQRWIILPDGALWSLPFEAFQASPDHYLIETNVISLSPSLTAAALMSPAAAAASVRSSRTASPARALLAFGNPVLNELTMERMQAMLPPNANKTDADAAQWERIAEALAALYPEKQRSIQSGAEATKTRFREEASQYRALYLGSRAVLNEAAPFFSGVALGASPNTTQDGVLDLREAIDLELKSDLVILPLTEPALPGVGLGRSLTGLSWAAYIAGCPTTLVSGRRMDPAANAELMIEFQKAYRSGGRKAEAWQSAIKNLLAREQYRSPSYWSGYSMLTGLR